MIIGEDCLVLNVWTPQPGNAGRRPVLMWIHGGGYFRGSGSSPWTDGAALAARGDAVVVSVNHRLGIFGYLHLTDAADGDYPESGNVGNLDLVLALEWVRENIAAFGGDPGCVTVFGCSGGACKIVNLLAMPAGGGLLHRAIVESGPAPVVHERAVAAELTERVLRDLGIERGGLGRLGELPADRLLAAAGAALGGRPMPSERAGVGLPDHGFAPVVDGVVLPHHPIAALKSGAALDVPLLIGSNREDVLAFGWMIRGGRDLSDDGLRDRLEPVLGDQVEQIVATYRETRPHASSLELIVAIMTDCMFRVSSTRLAEAHVEGATAPVYMYEFGWQALDGTVRPVHTMEVPFVFGTLQEVPDAASDPTASPTSRTIMDAWLAFARDGAPRSAGLAEWAPYALDRRLTASLEADPSVVADLRGAELRSWSEVPITRLGSGRMIAPPMPPSALESGG